MNAVQPDAVRGERSADELHSLSGRDGKPEFGIYGAGCDFFVRVRVNSGRDAQKDRLHRPSLNRFATDCAKLLRGIRYNDSDSRIHCKGNIRVGFVVAVEKNLFHRKSRRMCGVNFPGGYAVHAESFLRDNSVDSFEAECFGGIQRQGVRSVGAFHGTLPQTAHAADHVLVQQIKRRAVFFCQHNGVRSPEGEVTECIDREMTVQHGFLSGAVQRRTPDICEISRQSCGFPSPFAEEKGMTVVPGNSAGSVLTFSMHAVRSVLLSLSILVMTTR